jgi:hypothetical protein
MPHTCIDGFIDTFPLRFRTSQDSGVKQNNVLERVQRLMDVEMEFFQMV